MGDYYLTTSELCEKLKISRKTIYRMRKRGMPCVMAGRVPRYPYEKVLEWLQFQQSTSTKSNEKAELVNV